MHGRSVNTTQTHTGHTVSTHFGGHNLSVHSTQTNSIVVTSEWELLLSQPHSPSQHSLPTTHCTLHACTPLSAAGHMTTLLGGRSLGWDSGVICRECSPLHSHTAEWRSQGGGDHLTPSALRGPHPPEWTSTGGHPIVIGMCACVCCVCGPLVPVSLLQLTGLWQSGADTNPLHSLSECDPGVVYTLWCTVGGALSGQGHLMHSSL